MNLDDIKIFKKLDTGRVSEAMEALPDQMRQVLDEARLIKVPAEYSKATQVVLNGMGGSNIGAHILRSAFADKIKVPITITPGYSVPAHVNENTLYILSSYSGTTEEPLTVYHEVKKRRAKIMAISSDDPKSKLVKLMMKDDIPGYIFKPQFNPSLQPRLGLGYSIFGIASMIAKAGLFKINVREIEDIIASLEIWTRRLRPEAPTRVNAAKQIAQKIFGRVPVLVAAEHLTGNTHAMRNQINECSKSFASFLELPDLNHYTMEGLVNPASNRKNLAFLFFDSAFYHPRTQRRSGLTKQVVKKNKVAVISYEMKGDKKLLQNFELLQLGAWVSYYLGIAYKVNPATIPYVDWFKKMLK
ncbi:MAG: SIS domain-containing protein [Candidatus Falkowbacteria bacterium]